MNGESERVETLEELDKVLAELIASGYVQEWPGRETRFRATLAESTE